MPFLLTNPVDVFPFPTPGTIASDEKEATTAALVVNRGTTPR
jgi:hypothetical protein